MTKPTRDMKKLILLLFIPLLFTCSSDEDNNNSNETFLERYHGVVWNWVNFPPDEHEEGFYNWLMFNNNPQGYIEIIGNTNNNQPTECLNFIFDSYEIDDYTITILENHQNIISWQFEGNNTDNIEIVLVEASDDGNSINISSTGEDLIRIGQRTNMNQIFCD